MPVEKIPAGFYRQVLSRIAEQERYRLSDPKRGDVLFDQRSGHRIRIGKSVEVRQDHLVARGHSVGDGLCSGSRIGQIPLQPRRWIDQIADLTSSYPSIPLLFPIPWPIVGARPLRQSARRHTTMQPKSHVFTGDVIVARLEPNFEHEIPVVTTEMGPASCVFKTLLGEVGRDRIAGLQVDVPRRLFRRRAGRSMCLSNACLTCRRGSEEFRGLAKDGPHRCPPQIVNSDRSVPSRSGSGLEQTASTVASPSPTEM